MTFAGWIVEHLHELAKRLFVEILSEAKPVAPVLQRADSLLEGFLVGFADAHYFTHGAHLRPELVLSSTKLIERPTGELDDHIVAGRYVLFQGAFAPVGNLVQGDTRCQLGGDESNGEAGGF